MHGSQSKTSGTSSTPTARSSPSAWSSSAPAPLSPTPPEKALKGPPKSWPTSWSSRVSASSSCGGGRRCRPLQSPRRGAKTGPQGNSKAGSLPTAGCFLGLLSPSSRAASSSARPAQSSSFLPGITLTFRPHPPWSGPCTHRWTRRGWARWCPPMRVTVTKQGR